MMPYPVFLEAVYVGSKRHTGEYLAQETARIIEKLGLEKVCSIMTDNAFSNTSCWSILQTKYKKTRLICRGCAAHWLNLLVKDIFQNISVKKKLDDAVEVVKYFNNRHVTKAELRAAQIEQYGKTIALPQFRNQLAVNKAGATETLHRKRPMESSSM